MSPLGDWVPKHGDKVVVFGREGILTGLDPTPRTVWRNGSWLGHLNCQTCEITLLDGSRWWMGPVEVEGRFIRIRLADKTIKGTARMVAMGSIILGEGVEADASLTFVTDEEESRGIGFAGLTFPFPEKGFKP